MSGDVYENFDSDGAWLLTGHTNKKLVGVIFRGLRCSGRLLWIHHCLDIFKQR